MMSASQFDSITIQKAAIDFIIQVTKNLHTLTNTPQAKTFEFQQKKSRLNSLRLKKPNIYRINKIYATSFEEEGCGSPHILN